MADQVFGVVVVPSQQRAPRGATLLRTVSGIENVPDGPLWRGFSWRPDSCGDGDVVKATNLCLTPFAGFGDPVDRPDLQSYIPPIVAAGQECSAISGETELRDTVDRARALLERCQTVGVARELWRGDIAKSATPDAPNNYLSNATSYDDLTDGTPASVLDAMAMLEEGLAGCSCGGVGMIHATSRLVTYWQHLNLLERSPDGRLSTALGTLVVADPGYDGSAADGSVDADGSSSWAYATSMVDVRLGTVATTRNAADIGIVEANDFDVFAYRPFAATFDPCCHLAAQIDHTALT